MVTPPRITAYDHVGIRVSNPRRAVEFYERLGFRIVEEISTDRVAELTTDTGTRINLVFNGQERLVERNVLMDVPEKWPGYTHAAFIVDKLQNIVDWAAREGVKITEGPVDWGRRLTCFLRDPDGNVLEFNELVDAGIMDGAGANSQHIILHEYADSGNCYKVRLVAAYLGLPFERREYDITKGKTRTPEFLTGINANGRIPVLQIGDRYLPESNAICYYLASGSSLIPEGRFAVADMLRWMCYEQYNHEPNIGTLRFWLKAYGEDNLSEAQKTRMPALREGGEASLKLLDSHLASKSYMLGDDLSLADIVLYGYTSVAHEGGWDLSAYPEVQRWLDRIAAQPWVVPITA